MIIYKPKEIIAGVVKMNLKAPVPHDAKEDEDDFDLAKLMPAADWSQGHFGNEEASSTDPNRGEI